MNDIDYRTSSIPGVARGPGFVGGVCAGLSRSWSVDATVLRLGAAVGALFLGPLVVLAYLVAWLAIPADHTLAPSERPPLVPKVLVWALVAIVGAQIAFGLITSLPIRWFAVGALATWWILRKR